VISLGERGVRGVVLDIEGTTTPVTFVYNVLFPYARARLHEHASGDQLRALTAWMDQDAKVPELKRVQGLIWERGYADGTLSGVVFDDVPPALQRWRSAGIDIAIYSSGSVLAQRLLFGTTGAGDLTRLIGHYFDTGVGAKREAASYTRIAATMQCEPGALLFVSDIVAELDAARAAGLQTILCVRPGNAPQPATTAGVVSSFAELGA
jgi:enolase-phosphatase E1